MDFGIVVQQQAIAILLGVIGIFAFDQMKRPKWIPSLLMALAVFFIGINHEVLTVGSAVSVLFHELLLALFVVLAAGIAEWGQESRALNPIAKYAQSSGSLAFVVSILSYFFDNTAATAMATKIARPTKGKVAYAVYIVMIALFAGLASGIGDVTSFMAWQDGALSWMQLTNYLIPAAVGIFVLWLLLRNKMVLEFAAGELRGESDPKTERKKLAVVMATFVAAPLGHVLLHIPTGLTLLVLAYPTYFLLQKLTPEHLPFWPQHSDSHASLVGLEPGSKQWRKQKYEESFKLRDLGLFIWFVLFGVTIASQTFEIMGDTLKDSNEWAGGTFAMGFSAVIDNIPLAKAILESFNGKVSMVVFLVYFYFLGVGGGISPIGSSSSIYAASKYEITFTQYLRYAFHIILAIAAGALVLYAMIYYNALLI